MKNVLIIMFLSLFTSLSTGTAYGQREDDKENRIERLKSQKVAFMTERIGLSSADAQKFWPIYNEFSEKMDSLRHLERKNIHELHDKLEFFTDQQKENAIDRHINFDLEQSKLEKRYHEKFKQVLTIDQVIKLYEAEFDFKKKMLHLIREGKHSSCEDCNEMPKDLALNRIY